MRVALAAQSRALGLQLILHEPKSRQHHRVKLRFTRHPVKRKPQLSSCALLFRPLLANFPHGGFPPYGNPIFRSGEVCRHSKINSAQDISCEHTGHMVVADPTEGAASHANRRR
jgi:hypothetical protein